MSTFDDLVAVLEDLPLRDIEPEELRALCNNEVFQLLCSYCHREGGTNMARYDHDELGIDPEEDA